VKARPLLALGLYVISAGGGQLCLRIGSKSAGSGVASDAFALGAWARMLTNPWVVGGLSLWVVSTLVWLSVLAKSELSFAYGVGATSYVVVPVLAHLLFRESLPPLRIAGLVLIALGVACVLASREQVTS
jgi:drug/metabolite transporter (DMT)-like permease